VKFTRKFRQDGDGDIWTETFDDTGEMRSAYVLSDPDELAKARLELLKGRVEESIEERVSGLSKADVDALPHRFRHLVEYPSGD
jgi:hypothetical protein